MPAPVAHERQGESGQAGQATPTVALGDVLGDDFDLYAAKLAETGRVITRDMEIEPWWSIRDKLMAEGFGEVDEQTRAGLFAQQANLEPDEVIDEAWVIQIAGLGGRDPSSLDYGALSQAVAEAPVLNDAIREAVDAFYDTVSYHLENKLASDRVVRSPLLMDPELMAPELVATPDPARTAPGGPIFSRGGAKGGQWFYSVSVDQSDDPLLAEAEEAIDRARIARRDALRALLAPDGD